MFYANSISSVYLKTVKTSSFIYLTPSFGSFINSINLTSTSPSLKILYNPTPWKIYE